MKNILYSILWFIVGFTIGWFVIVPAINYYTGNSISGEPVAEGVNVDCEQKLIDHANKTIEITKTYISLANNFASKGNQDSLNFYLDSAGLYLFHAEQLSIYLDGPNEAN